MQNINPNVPNAGLGGRTDVKVMFRSDVSKRNNIAADDFLAKQQ